MREFLVRSTGIYIIAIGTIAIVLGLSIWNIIVWGLAAAITYLVLLGFWPVFTGTGIILHKNWARYSLSMMSVFALCAGISSLLPLIFVPRSVIEPKSALTHTVLEIFILIINFVFFIVLPAIFLIFFNRKDVKRLFKTKQIERPRQARPLGITLVAIFTFFTAVSFTIFLFEPAYAKFSSTFIGTILLTGKLERLYFLIVALVNFYISFGFFKLKKSALLVFEIFIITSIVIGAINSLIVPKITVFVRLPDVSNAYLEIPQALYELSSFLVILIPISLLFYVLSKKKLFSRQNEK